MRRIGCRRQAPMLKAAALVVCLLTNFSWTVSAIAEGSSQPYGRGGPIGVSQIVAQYNRTGELFRIEGYCRSSCTMLLAIRNACVDPSGTLAFHANVRSPQEPVSAERNKRMLSHYNARLRAFLVANHYLDSYNFHEVSGSDIIRKFGYRRCPNK